MDIKKLVEEFGELRFSITKLKELEELLESNRGVNFVLIYLIKHKREMNPKEISRALNVSSARVAAILKNMENKGLIERLADPQNGRQILIRVLPFGKEFYKKIHARFHTNAMELLQALGEEDAVQYIRIQKKLVEYYEKKNEIRRNEK